MTLLPIPKSIALIWLNIALSLILAAIGLGVGFSQGILPAQQVILFTIAITALVFVLLNYIAVVFEARAEAVAAASDEDKHAESGRALAFWRNNRILIIAMAALLILYLLITAGVPEFRSIKNLIAFLVLELILLFSFKVSGYFAAGRSALSA